MQRTPIILTVSLLTLISLLVIPSPATAQGACDGTETFEDNANFQAPAECWYTAAGMGSSAVTTFRPYQGTKSLDVPSAGSPTPAFVFVPAMGACTDGVPITASWFVNLDTMPEAGRALQMGFGAISPFTSAAYVAISSAGAISLTTDINTAFPGLTILIDTWYGVSLTVSCTSGPDSVYATAWLASDYAGTVSGASRSGLSKSNGANPQLEFSQFGGVFPKYFLDNLQISPYDDTLAAFCADPNILNYNGVAEADYGYDYRRGGDFFDQSDDDVPGIGLSTGFDYTGSDGTEAQFDYSAKHFTTGTKALHQNITIESAEGSPPIQSAFRVNYHTQLTTVADVTAKGNGLTTGHFADHVEVEIKSLLTDAWYITFWYVNAGGTRSQIGGSHTFGDSFDATQFTVWLDTRSTANAITTLDNHHGNDWYISGGGSLHADPFVLLTTDSAADGPNGEEIAVIGIRYLDDIAGNPFLDDTVGDIWNVAMGEIGVASPWHIALDEDNQEGRANTDDEGGLDSTCIFDDAGTAVFANSPGATPGSLNPPPDPEPEPTSSTTLTGPAQSTGNPLGDMVQLINVAWGFDWSWIIGAVIQSVILIPIVIATKGNPMVCGLIIVITTVANIKLGLYPEWSLLVMVFLIIALASNRLFNKREAGEDAA